jgi:Kef-type K+ transport system membrane component KefB
MTLAFFAAGQVETLFNLFAIFAAAKIAAEACERLRQPVVVGEILAGVVIGPGGLGVVHPSEVTQALAEIGVILLLFIVGLEISPRRLLEVGRTAALVAIGGVVLPFVAGYGLLRLYGEGAPQALFFGAALVATSVGITARVLGGMGVILAKTSQIILGAAVIDDILGLIVLSFVSSLSTGSIRYAELIVTAVLPVAFTIFMLTFGARLVHRTRPAIERLRVGQAFFVAGMLLCFGLSWLSAVIGVAAIIGAFLAGIALSESSEDTDLLKQASAVTEVAVPFFMVGIGMQVNVAIFQDATVIGLAALATFVAVAAKVVGCGLGARKLGWRAALQVGMGMAPRGEVGVIIAQVGKKSGVFSDSLFGLTVFVAVATTLIAPPFLRILFRGKRNPNDSPTRSFPKLG